MTKTIGVKPYTDHRDLQSTPPSTTEGGTDNPRKKYPGQLEQLSQNDEGYSGLPLKSDGSPRHNSRASSPLAQPDKTGKTKPVNE